MKDISLYGHLTIDTILDGDGEKDIRFNGKCMKALLEVDASLDIGPRQLM